MKIFATRSIVFLVVFCSAFTTYSSAPNFSLSSLDFGCEGRVGEEVVDLEIESIVREQAVVIFQGEQEVQGVLLHARITQEPGHPHEAVDFVVEFRQNSESNKEARISSTAALNPSYGLDKDGAVVSWREAYLRLSLPGYEKLSIACYSKPTTSVPTSDPVSRRTSP